MHPPFVFYFPLVNPFYVEGETPIPNLEGQQHEGDSKVPELHEGADHQVQHRSNTPQYELHQLVIVVDDQTEDRDEAKRVDQAHRILRPFEVAIDVKHIVPVVC